MLLLLQLLMMLNLLIVLRERVNHYRYNVSSHAWVFLDALTRNQIHDILVNKRLRNSAKDTRVYMSANVGSDIKVHRIQTKSKSERNYEKVVDTLPAYIYLTYD